MPDQFSSVVTTGLGGRMINSVKGILVGFIFFIVSFGLLYWNEGRADLSVVAKQAVSIDASVQNTALDGKLVAAKGDLHTDALLGDGLFLNPGPFLAVQRTVEMYAWVEKESSQTNKNLGGSETTTKTYTYDKEWTSSPTESSRFAHPEGHTNPAPTLQSATIRAAAASLGLYALNVPALELPPMTSISLNSQSINVASTLGATLASPDYIFISQTAGDTLNAPQIGDERVSYGYIGSNDSALIFAKLDGFKLSPYVTSKGDTLYRAFLSTKDQAIAQMHSEYSSLTWILRLVGFLLMWIGLAMLLDPVSVFLDILPIAGSISRSLIGLMTFVIALVLTIVTIVVSMILHSLIAVIVALVITLIVVGLVLKNKYRKAPSTS